MVVAIRSRATAEGSFQTAQSVLDRWEAVEERRGLHSAFEQLGSRKTGTSSELPNAIGLRKLESIVINKVIVGFHAIQLGKALLLTMSDGTVEYRDRYSFDELYTTEDLTKVMNLRQVGWNFPQDGPCTCATPTPRASILTTGQASRSPYRRRTVPWPSWATTESYDGASCTTQWVTLATPCKKVQLRYVDPGRGLRLMRIPGHYAASVAALAVMAAPSIWCQNNYDDILAVVHPLTTKKSKQPPTSPSPQRDEC